MFHCRVPFCQCSGAPLSSPSIHDEAKSVSNINSHNTYPPSYSPSLSALVATSPTSGGQMDLPFRDAGNPCCMQQPPNHVIDYWFHRLGLSVQTTSAETLSNLPIVGTSSNPPTGVPLFPVLGEINSRVSPNFITSYCVCFAFEVYEIYIDWSSLVPSRNFRYQADSSRTPFDCQ